MLVYPCNIFLLGIHQVTTGVLQGLERTSIPLMVIGQSELLAIGLTSLYGGLAYGGIMIATVGVNKRDIERILCIGVILKERL